MSKRIVRRQELSKAEIDQFRAGVKLSEQEAKLEDSFDTVEERKREQNRRREESIDRAVRSRAASDHFAKPPSCDTLLLTLLRCLCHYDTPYKYRPETSKAEEHIRHAARQAKTSDEGRRNKLSAE
jgi:hypothetical protein